MVEMKIGGVIYHPKLSFGALKTIEKLADAGLMKISSRIIDGDIRHVDIAAILYAAILEVEPRAQITFDIVGDSIIDDFGSYSNDAIQLVNDFVGRSNKKKDATTTK